jgi:hypothetical protein
MIRSLLLCWPLIAGCQATLDVSEEQVSLTLPADSISDNDCVAIRATHINDALGVKEIVFTEGVAKPFTLYAGQNDITAVASAKTAAYCPATYDAVAMIKAYEASTTLNVVKGGGNTLNLDFRSVGAVDIHATYPDLATAPDMAGGGSSLAITNLLVNLPILSTTVGCAGGAPNCNLAGGLLQVTFNKPVSTASATLQTSYATTPTGSLTPVSGVPGSVWSTGFPPGVACPANVLLTATADGATASTTFSYGCGP